MSKTAKSAVHPYSTRSKLTVTIASITYLLLSWLVVGFKPDQIVLVVLYNILYHSSAVSRKFILGFSIFVVYWIIYDYMKAFPNYEFNIVHIKDLYDAEKNIFGVKFNNLLVTPNEYWRANGNSVLDVLTGIFYLCWIPVPIAFSVYLFFANRRQFLCFLLTFFLVNILGFIVYYLYPAAPPWYVQFHGFDFIKLTQGNTAGLIKFDQIFNLNVFQSIYSKGSNVFAAMPSLHSAYPLVVLYYGLKSKLGSVNIFFAIVAIGIWFAAVYTSHHYILDVVFGIICAIIGIILFELLLAKTSIKKFVDQYEQLIK